MRLLVVTFFVVLIVVVGILRLERGASKTRLTGERAGLPVATVNRQEPRQSGIPHFWGNVCHTLLLLSLLLRCSTTSFLNVRYLRNGPVKPGLHSAFEYSGSIPVADRNNATTHEHLTLELIAVCVCSCC